MSRNKKILIGVGVGAGCLFLALLVLPLAFIDDVEARVRSEIERATRVRVSWSDIGLTFFRDFPHPTFSLSGLTVVGTGRFDGDTLATVGDFRLALNATSVLGAVRGSGPLVIRSVTIDRPMLRLQVDDDGTASWDVLPEAEPSDGGGSGRAVAVSLRRLDLSDGDIVLDNAQSGLFVSMSGLDHSLRGDFSREALTARTLTHSDAVTVRFAGTPYLGGAALDFDADFDVDMVEQRARLIDNELRLNDLALQLDGELARQGEDLAMDLTFGAPSTEFGQILSLVPAVYAQDFASLETGGTFTLDGNVRGSYGREAFPSFALDLNIVDGGFRYPDMPLPARAIAADLSVSNPGGDIDSTVVDLSRFHMEIGDQPVDASLRLRTPVSDPEADVRVQGTLDLADVARTVKLANAEGLGGVIVADARMHARRSDVDSARYDRIDAEGTVEARGVTLRGPSLRQPVDVREASLELTPQAARLRSLDAQLGSSDLQATGQLDNLLGFALGQQPLRGEASFTSRRFVLDEWRSGEALEVIPVPPRLDLTLDGAIQELAFSGIEMTNARGRAIVREERLTFDGFSLQTLGGRVGMDGYYETTDPTRPTFALALDMDSLDVAGAAASVATVRALAPVARFARGTFSSQLDLSGALGQDMAPVLDVLDGDGSLSTSRVAIEGFPLLDRLAETLQLQRFSNPTVDAIRSTIHIQDGRLVVDPFDVNVAGLAMTVSGSNGIDQSIDYTLGIDVPRAGFAEAALSGLASRAGPLGAGLAAVDPVRVGVRVTGNVSQPALSVGLGQTATSVGGAVSQAAGDAVQERVDSVRQQIDASTEEARRRARAQADSLVAGAERQADEIRAQAARAAAEIRSEGNRAADEVLSRASNPVARAAAQPVADRLRQEAEQRAAGVEREADERASALVAEAQARADAILEGAGAR
jgi:hypothetical protein